MVDELRDFMYEAGYVDAPTPDAHPDIVVRAPDGTVVVIEVKVLTTRSSIDNLRQALGQVLTYAATAEQWHTAPIVPAVVVTREPDSDLIRRAYERAGVILTSRYEDLLPDTAVFRDAAHRGSMLVAERERTSRPTGVEPEPDQP